MLPGVRGQASDADSQQHKLDLLMEEKSIVSQLFEPDTIDVCHSRSYDFVDYWVVSSGSQ